MTAQMPSKELIGRIDDCLNRLWIDRVVSEASARGLLREAMEALIRQLEEMRVAAAAAAFKRAENEPGARQCNHGAISPKGTMFYHGFIVPTANLWRCDVCKGVYEGNLTDPKAPGSQGLTLVSSSQPPPDELAALRKVYEQASQLTAFIGHTGEVSSQDGHVDALVCALDDYDRLRPSPTKSVEGG